MAYSNSYIQLGDAFVSKYRAGGLTGPSERSGPGLYPLKQPSHGKLKLANSCWQTQVAVYERRKNSQQTRTIYRQQFADMLLFFRRSHIPS